MEDEKELDMNESFIAGSWIILTLIDFVACGEICMQKMKKLDSFGGREQQDFYNRSSWTSLHLLLFLRLFRGGETPLHADAWQEREVAWKRAEGLFRRGWGKMNGLKIEVGEDELWPRLWDYTHVLSVHLSLSVLTLVTFAGGFIWLCVHHMTKADIYMLYAAVRVCVQHILYYGVDTVPYSRSPVFGKKCMTHGGYSGHTDGFIFFCLLADQCWALSCREEHWVTTVHTHTLLIASECIFLWPPF